MTNDEINEAIKKLMAKEQEQIKEIASLSYQRGIYQLLMGNTKEALELFERAIGLDPTNEVYKSKARELLKQM